LLNEVHDLPIQGGLEPIRYVADYFLAKVDRLLADRRIEIHNPADRFW